MDNWLAKASIATISARAELYATIRQFFADRKVLEVDTPLLASYGVTDPYVENIVVPVDGHQDQYLQTSPEYAIKRLLAAGLGDCYQLGKAFRQEFEGRQHRREFTMLEWYRLGWTAEQLQDEVVQLFSQCGIQTESLVSKTYQQWFEDVLHINPFSVTDEALVQAVQPLGLNSQLCRDEMLDLLMSRYIEPALAEHSVAIISGFPASRAALAQLDADNPAVANRFEIYLHGIEITNGYQELTDASVLRKRWIADNQLRQQQGKPVRSFDEQLLAAMQAGLPECAGVALGVDRLLMAILNLDDIADTML